MGSGTSWSAGLARTLALWRQAWRKQTRSERRPEQLVDRTLANAALARADVTSARAQVQSDLSRMMRYFDVDPGLRFKGCSQPWRSGSIGYQAKARDTIQGHGVS
jgi:hypothetical protein